MTPSAGACPLCREEGALLAGKAAGESVCERCGGHFLDGAAARELVTGRLGISEEVLEGLTAEFAPRGGKLSCPHCRTALSGCVLRCVALDLCRGCGGIWFDAGELHRLSKGRQGRAAVLAAPASRTRRSAERRLEVDVTTPVERALLLGAAALAAGSALLASRSVFSGQEWAILLTFLALPLPAARVWPAWLLSALYVALAGGGAAWFATWSLEIGQIELVAAQRVQAGAGLSLLLFLIGCLWNESYLVDFDRRVVLILRQFFGLRWEGTVAPFEEVVATATKRWTLEYEDGREHHYAQAVLALRTGQLVPLSSASRSEERADRVARQAAEEMNVPHVDGSDGAHLLVVRRGGEARLVEGSPPLSSMLFHAGLAVGITLLYGLWPS